MKRVLLVFLVFITNVCQAASMTDLADFRLLASELEIEIFKVVMEYDEPVYIAIKYKSSLDGKILDEELVTLSSASEMVGIEFMYRPVYSDVNHNTGYHFIRSTLSNWKSKNSLGKLRKVQTGSPEYFHKQINSEFANNRMVVVNRFKLVGENPLPLNVNSQFFSLRDLNTKILYEVYFEVSDKAFK